MPLTNKIQRRECEPKFERRPDDCITHRGCPMCGGTGRVSTGLRYQDLQMTSQSNVGTRRCDYYNPTAGVQE